MSRQDWLRHINSVPYALDSDGRLNKESVRSHAETCTECAKRRKTKKQNRAKRDRDETMRSLGMVKVKGSVSGRTYWE